MKDFERDTGGGPYPPLPSCDALTLEGFAGLLETKIGAEVVLTGSCPQTFSPPKCLGKWKIKLKDGQFQRD